MQEVTKKVAPGKINHKNAIKSCQIVLLSSKTTTEKPRSSTVVCFDLPIFTKHSLENNEQKRQYSKFDASYLPIDQAKRSMTLLPVQMF